MYVALKPFIVTDESVTKFTTSALLNEVTGWGRSDPQYRPKRSTIEFPMLLKFIKDYI